MYVPHQYDQYDLGRLMEVAPQSPPRYQVLYVLLGCDESPPCASVTLVPWMIDMGVCDVELTDEWEYNYATENIFEDTPLGRTLLVVKEVA